MNYIPKKIHYAWFGKGQMNEEALRCIQSWKKYLPDYEIIEWNEDNFPFEKYPYATEAYDNRKYAYVADVARLHALYYYGGIYMDTDVEVIKNLDSFLKYHAFSGFQSEREIPTGIIAAEENNQWVLDQLEYYYDAHFILDEILEKKITNVEIITEISLKKHGLLLNNTQQELKYGMMLFPDYVFCAKSPGSGKIFANEGTYTIHHFAGSWVPKASQRNKRMYRIAVNIIGQRCADRIYSMIAAKKKDK